MYRTLIILLLALSTYSTRACECKVPYTFEQNFKDAPLVLKVRVVGIRDSVQIGFLPDKQLGNLYPPFSSGYTPVLKITKRYKGKLKEKIITLSNTQECGDKYTLGQEYVLFIYRGRESYFTRICENNFPASDTGSFAKLKAILRAG